MTPTERQSMLNSISDLSKDATGCRVRWDYANMTDAELQDSWDYFIRAMEDSQVIEAQHKLEAQRRWEKHINNLVAMGAANRATALRWDMQAHDAHEVDYYCYLNDLAYELEPRIEKELR